jgi:hypothetical protein
MQPKEDDITVEDVEILLLLLIIEVASLSLEALDTNVRTLLRDHIREQQRLNRSQPEEKRRPTWEGFSTQISPTHF